MAIKLEDKQNTLPPSPDYPFGDILNDTGANDGTPVDRTVYADFHQFFAKLADYAGVTLNGLPDNNLNGFQYFDSLIGLNKILNGKRNFNEKVSEITLGAVGLLTSNFFVINDLFYVVDKDVDLCKVFDVTGVEVQAIGAGVITNELRAVFVNKKDNDKVYLISENVGGEMFIDVFDNAGNHIPAESFSTGAVTSTTVFDIYVDDINVYFCGDQGGNMRLYIADKGSGIIIKNKTFGAGSLRRIMPSDSGKILSCFNSVSGSVLQYNIDNDSNRAVGLDVGGAALHYDSGTIYGYYPATNSLQGFDPNSGVKTWVEDYATINEAGIEDMFIRENTLYLFDRLGKKIQVYKKNLIEKSI